MFLIAQSVIELILEMYLSYKGGKNETVRFQKAGR